MGFRADRKGARILDSRDVPSNYLDDIALLIRDEVAPDAVPKQHDSVPLFRIYAVLLLARGGAVTASDIHNAWVAWMAGIDPAHDQLKPYDRLDPEIAALDDRYVEAIRRVALRIAAANPTRRARR